MASKTPADIRKMKKDELLAYAIEITAKFEALSMTLEDFGSRLDALEKKATEPILNDQPNIQNDETLAKIEKIERENINNAQYLRRRQIELWNLPGDITNKLDMKKDAAELLSLTGVPVSASDIDLCHKLKKEGQIILEFKNRDVRDRVIRARKNLKGKQPELSAKNCPKLSVVESVCFEYKRLDYVARQLKSRNLLASTWFFNRKLYIVDLDDTKAEIRHLNDLINKCGRNIVDEILS